MAKSRNSPTSSDEAARFARAIEAVMHNLRVSASAQGETARYLKYSQLDFQALRWIAADDRPTPGGLAHYLDVAPTTVTSLLDRLADKDLVSRAPSTRDRRRIALSLTTRGKRAVAAIAAEDRAGCTAMLDMLDGSAREVMLQSLEAVAGLTKADRVTAQSDAEATKTPAPKRGLLGRRSKASMPADKTPRATPPKMTTDRVKPARKPR